MPTRILNVTGKAELGTEVRFEIDDQLQINTISNHSASEFELGCVNLYSWTTDVEFHGWKKIKLTVSKPVLIQRTVGAYPAVWVDDQGTQHWGQLVNYQHTVPDPKFLVAFDGDLVPRSNDDTHLQGEFFYHLEPGVEMTYYHLLRGGVHCYYLHLEHKPDLQQQWIASKHFFIPKQKIFYSGILNQPYAKRLHNEYELELLKSSALKDFKNIDQDLKLSYNNNMEGGPDGKAAVC